MKKAAFPKVIRVGQTKATIYKNRSHGCVSYMVVWYVGTVRHRKAFADLDLATLHAQAQVNNLSKGEARVAKLTGEECLEYVRAREMVKEFGLTLDTMAAEYRDAKRLVRKRSLVEVARKFAEKELVDLPVKTVLQVYEEMVKAKRDEGCSERYLQDLKSRLGKFAREFPKEIAAVTGQEIKTWLQALMRETSKKDKRAPKKPVTNRTRNNFRLCVQTLFSFAKAQKYLAADWNEMDAVPVWKMKEEEAEIFTPEEMSILLAHAPANLVPFLTIGGFAGLRSAEIERLDCPHGCGCDHRIHKRANGALAGVCQCEPWNCDDLAVTPELATLLTLNTAKLGREICRALECDARMAALPLPLTWQIGAKFANGVPVLLTIQDGRQQFRRVVAELTARQRQPFILLTPTSRHWDAPSRELLVTARAGCFDLESNHTIAANGSLHPKTSPGLLFQAFVPDSAAASDGEAQRLFALVKALESESNYRKAPVTRVFQLYCLEAESRNGVAKACRCSPALITLRLKAIEKKLGRKPAELRVLSSQFERIADALVDSRARRIDRKRQVEDEDPADED